MREYIEYYYIGGGNWTGEQVYDDNGNLIGRIYYNGRFIQQND